MYVCVRMIELTAEDYSYEDLYYCLDRALLDDRITLDKFLKVCFCAYVCTYVTEPVLSHDIRFAYLLQHRPLQQQHSHDCNTCSYTRIYTQYSECEK